MLRSLNIVRIHVWIVMLLLAACGGGNNNNEPPTSGGSPPPSGQTLLDNGGTVFGPNGVGIHAMSNTLDAPVDISIATTFAPPEAMDSRVIVQSDYYLIGADRNVTISKLSPFVVSFPVPQDVDTTHLALAIRIPAELVNDTEQTGMQWSYLSGRYDADEGTFVALLPYISADDFVHALVTHPGYSSPLTTDFTVAQTDNTVITQAVGGGISDFTVKCSLDIFAYCTPDFYLQISSITRAAYLEYISLGFREPDLAIESNYYDFSSNSYQADAYIIHVAHNELNILCKNKYGFYDPLLFGIVLCVAPDENGNLSVPLDLAETIRHELFHAIQYAYSETKSLVLWGLTRHDWFIEGTATAAEFSYIDDGPGDASMFRSQHYPAYPIYESLRSDIRTDQSILGIETLKYAAQDFWVYVGRSAGLDMNYLIPILEHGPTLNNISAYLPTDVGALGQAYWSWIKNATFERVIETDVMHIDEVAPCQLAKSIVYSDDVLIPTHGVPWTFAAYNRDDLFPLLTVSPLSSRLVRIEQSDGFPPEIAISSIVSSLGPDIRIKVYSEFDSVDAELCRDGLAEGLRRLDTTQFTFAAYGNPNYVYILISNLHLTDSQTIELVTYVPD